MVTNLLAFILLTLAAPPNAQTAASSNVASLLNSEIVSKYCRIRFTAGKEQDARQLAVYADSSLTKMAGKLSPLDPNLMDNFTCTILQFATPQSGLADDATANAHTEDRGRLIDLSILAGSSFSPASRTVVGEPKDSDFVFNIVANELSTILFERITRDKRKGWYFHDAPQWFVQGVEGYFGLTYSSAHYREVTLPKYINAVRVRSDEVGFGNGVRVRNPYVGGVVLVAFLYDVYGESRFNSLLTNSATTFDEAFAATFGDWAQIETKYRDWIENPAAFGPPAPAGDKPAFEVASIKPSPTGDNRVGIGIPPGRFMATGLTTKRLIEFAYNLKDDQLSAGPSWINSERYDIDAKEADSLVEALQNLPLDQRADQIRLMVQSLLADRFKLRVNRQTKELPVFALVVAQNGPKLTQTSIAPPGPADTSPQESPRGPMISGGRGQFTGTAVPISLLADALARLPEIGGRVVLDQTELKGNYDFKLQWTPESPTPPSSATGPGDSSQPPGNASVPDASGPSIFTALQEQIGLRLESRKGPVDVLVIDHIEEPSPN